MKAAAVNERILFNKFGSSLFSSGFFWFVSWQINTEEKTRFATTKLQNPFALCFFRQCNFSDFYSKLKIAMQFTFKLVKTRQDYYTISV